MCVCLSACLYVCVYVGMYVPIYICISFPINNIKNDWSLQVQNDKYNQIFDAKYTRG